MSLTPHQDAALTAERERAEQAEAEILETRAALSLLEDQFAAMAERRRRTERERDAAIRERDAAIRERDAIKRETIERCAKVVAEIAERHGEASVKCHEEGLKHASQLASYVARSVDEIAAVIRAMREGE